MHVVSSVGQVATPSTPRLQLDPLFPNASASFTRVGTGQLPPSPTITDVDDEQVDPEIAELLGQLRQKWLKDITAFARDVFDVHLWWGQRCIVEIISSEASAGHVFRIAIRSGHKCGKSMVLAIIAIWWAMMFEKSRVIITAPSARLIRDTLWREIKGLYNRAQERLAELGIEGGIGGRLFEVPSAGWKFDDQTEILGFSTNQPERMAGTSGANILYLVDEASGVSEPIFSAIDGNRAGGGSMVMFSNPTQTSGYFFDAFHSKKELWYRVHLSSAQTPNVIAKRTVIPGIAEYGWVLERQAEYGPEYENDIQYQIRVLGDFPSSATQQILTTRDLRMGKTNFLNFVAKLFQNKEVFETDDYATKERYYALMARNKEHYRYIMSAWCSRHTGHPLVIGVDPAWYGDDRTTIFLRRGPRMFPPGICTKFDGPAVANLILQYAETYRWGVDEHPIVMIDVNGIGASAYDTLRRARGIRVVGVNSQHPPSAKRFKRPGADPNEYQNLRAEMAFGAKAWLREGGGFVPNDELERELLAPQYFIDGMGRICVEKKAEIKKKLNNRSPDLGDGFSIACCDNAIPPDVHVPPDITKLIQSSSRFSGLPGQGF